MQTVIIPGQDRVSSRLSALLKQHGQGFKKPIVATHDAAHKVITRLDPPPDLVFVAEGDDASEARNTIYKLGEVTGAPLVAVGAGRGPEHILTMIRSGACDYLDDASLEESLVALLRRMRANQAARRGRGSMVAIVAASGGSGCSMLAVNLAAEFARDRGRCGLIDLKLRGGDLATLLGVKASSHIGDLCRNPELDRPSLEIAMQAHPSGIRLLASPPLLEHVGVIDADAISRLIVLATEVFTATVVDLEDIFHREQMRVIAACDTLIMLTRLDFVSLVRTRKSLMYLEREGVDLKKIEVVANRSGISGEVAPAKAAEALGRPIQHAIPENSKCVTAANNLAKPLVLESRPSNVAKAIHGLAADLLARR